VDALVFTGGIGENDAQLRHQICTGLEQLGFCLDPALNTASFHGAQAIHATESRSQLYVIPTDEELEIARQTMDCIRGS
jgi:acetate kinase